MKILGSEYTTREVILLSLVLLLSLAFFLNAYFMQLTLKEYVNPYNECISKLNMCIGGVLPLDQTWDNKPMNVSLNFMS